MTAHVTSGFISGDRQSVAHDVAEPSSGTHPSLRDQSRQEGVAWNTSSFMLAGHKHTGATSGSCVLCLASDLLGGRRFHTPMSTRIGQIGNSDGNWTELDGRLDFSLSPIFQNEAEGGHPRKCGFSRVSGSTRRTDPGFECFNWNVSLLLLLYCYQNVTHTPHTQHFGTSLLASCCGGDV